jgi:hypothetical protein
MTLALITPSYRNDVDLFGDLHQSVMRMTDNSVIHYAIVPKADMELFNVMAGPRCIVVSEESLYPSHYRTIRGLNELVRLIPRVPAHARIAAVNTKKMFRPVRGWMMQQVLKLEMCRQLNVDTALLTDSDVELVRPLSEATFRDGDHARLYRRPKQTDGWLPTHMEWIKNSRVLLDLPPAEFPASEYISSFCVWEPAIVRAMLAHVEQVTGKHWMDAIVGLPTFSEWTLYGVFAEEIMKYDESVMTESSLCHSYWDTTPLTMERGIEFASHIAPDDVAVLIQSKSHTPRAVRRATIGAIDREVRSQDDQARLV